MFQIQFSSVTSQISVLTRRRFRRERRIRMRPRELVKAWVDAFNRRDVDSLAAFYSETAINYQVPEEPVSGREAIRTMFKNGFALAEMVCIPENIFEDGEWAI